MCCLSLSLKGPKLHNMSCNVTSQLDTHPFRGPSAERQSSAQVFTSQSSSSRSLSCWDVVSASRNTCHILRFLCHAMALIKLWARRWLAEIQSQPSRHYKSKTLKDIFQDTTWYSHSTSPLRFDSFFPNSLALQLAQLLSPIQNPDLLLRCGQVQPCVLCTSSFSGTTTTYYNILQHTTTYYNILQPIPLKMRQLLPS